MVFLNLEFRMISFHNKTMNQVAHFFCRNGNMSYVIFDGTIKDCVIVDPSWDVDQLIDYISKAVIAFIGDMDYACAF